ncbi:MAG TPA: hypothetical protein VFQ62_06110 [Methylomirabilota bacterium]|nr:hypothetical protein [Methylomirabilota bacterium]
MVGQRMVTGQVTQVDHTTGVFTLKTPDSRTLDLRAQPSAVAGLNPGDTVTVQITAPAR